MGRTDPAAHRSGLNTTYIERLNATFRVRLAPLACRTRASGVHWQATPEARMWLVGCCYNFWWEHRSSRAVGGDRRAEEERTPAQAPGLTDRPWALMELLSLPVPPSYTPKRQGRYRSGWWRLPVRPNHGSM